jgi:hypothetical protein|nr:RagB/SusD family nutrient uptake outer membrane protein [uncultured Porphyromonas sp.]
MRYFISCLALSLLATACNLDYTSTNAINYSNAFNRESELNATTVSIHFYLNNCLESSSILTQVGLIADETTSSDELREWNPRTVIGGNYDWKPLYNVIYEANLLLENIGRTQGLTDERRAYHVGQAQFALGFAYFTLSRAFGLAVIPESTSAIRQYPLSSMLQVIDKAIYHAEQAYSVLPTYDKLRNLSGATVSSKQFASKGNSAALLAHLYAWKGSMIELYGLSGASAQEAYRKSVDYASVLINGQAGNYSLLSSPEELCKRLSDPAADNPEEIFSLVYDKTRSNNSVSHNEVAALYCTWPVDKTLSLGDITNAPFRLLASTVRSLYPDAGDARRTAFFYEADQTHEVAGKDYAIPYKFRNAIFVNDASSSSGLSFVSIDANYVYWRLADIYLLRAECYAKLGETGSATSDLNRIRQRAGATDYPAPGESDLKEAIFHEREREFLLENDSRYYDILRNGYQTTKLQGKFQQLTATDIAGGALNLPVPSAAFQDKTGKIINGSILQRKYWVSYF